MKCLHQECMNDYLEYQKRNEVKDLEEKEEEKIVMENENNRNCEEEEKRNGNFLEKIKEVYLKQKKIM